MKCLLIMLAGSLAALLFAATEPARESAAATAPHPLVWDAMEKAIQARASGDGVAQFEFTVTNTSDAPVEILHVRPSCGCTTADVPATPWVLQPKASGSFRAMVDFRGKHGRFAKAIHVVSTAGTQMLTAVVNIIETEEERRQRNQQVALTDRQAVFRGDCATCHVAPIGDLKGEPLFTVACGICHQAAHRASMVPDLLTANSPRDAAYWRQWIADGREGSLMPAFARRHGGPLTDEQIDSLIEYALSKLGAKPRAD